MALSADCLLYAPMQHIYVGAVQLATLPMITVQDLAVNNEYAQCSYMLQDYKTSDVYKNAHS